MALGSDNPFPSMLYVEGTTPASPSSGRQRLFVRSSDHVLCMVNSGGTVTPLSGSLTNPMTTVGDLIRGGTAGAPTALAASSTAGQFLMNGGTATAPAWASRELDYAQFTGTVSPTATTEATANTVISGNAVSYDGSTIVMIEFFAPLAEPDAGVTGRTLLFALYDGSSSIGIWGYMFSQAANNGYKPVYLSRRLTPSNASHTYSVRAYVDAGTATIGAGAGGVGVNMPGFIRITRAV